ncbi:hypothetical protein QZM72_06270 [Burkholderia sp. AU45388]|nr:hypothetical protein [Burkholderia sp. AU45388]
MLSVCIATRIPVALSPPASYSAPGIATPNSAPAIRTTFISAAAVPMRAAS